MRIDEDSAKVRIPPPALYLGALAAGLIVDWIIGQFSARAGGLGLASHIRWLAGLLIATPGLGLILASAGLFRRAGTQLPPWKSTTRLVIGGPFRWTRNPIYLGMTLIYAGLAIALDSFFALIFLAILVLPVMKTQVISKEERYLESKFGDDYRAYKARVRRWL